MLFDPKIQPSCEYCFHGTPLGYNEVACVKRGIMDTIGACGAFRYEPTKREPLFAQNLKASGLTEDDFKL
jgi:hypothetical protein